MDRQLFLAASNGDLQFFEKLTDPISSTLLQVTTEKNTVLHVALQCEQFHVVEELVRLRPSLVYEKKLQRQYSATCCCEVGRSIFNGKAHNTEGQRSAGC